MSPTAVGSWLCCRAELCRQVCQSGDIVLWVSDRPLGFRPALRSLCCALTQLSARLGTLPLGVFLWFSTSLHAEFGAHVRKVPLGGQPATLWLHPAQLGVLARTWRPHAVEAAVLQAPRSVASLPPTLVSQLWAPSSPVPLFPRNFLSGCRLPPLKPAAGKGRPPRLVGGPVVSKGAHLPGLAWGRGKGEFSAPARQDLRVYGGRSGGRSHARGPWRGLSPTFLSQGVSSGGICRREVSGGHSPSSGQWGAPGVPARSQGKPQSRLLADPTALPGSPDRRGTLGPPS